MSAQLSLLDVQAMAAPAKTLPVVGCLAQLDDLMRALPNGAPGDVVGTWETYGGEIVIDGLFVSRGSLGMNAVRWHCTKHGRGIFGRGLACYGERMPAWANNLPKVK